MMPKLTLYTRKDCCLCVEMKAVIEEIAAKIPVEIAEVDIDQSVELRARFGEEIPILCIDGRRAFKFRVTAKQLERRLRRHSRRGYLAWLRNVLSSDKKIWPA
jgi:glutaredoxin